MLNKNSIYIKSCNESERNLVQNGETSFQGRLGFSYLAKALQFVVGKSHGLCGVTPHSRFQNSLQTFIVGPGKDGKGLVLR